MNNKRFYDKDIETFFKTKILSSNTKQRKLISFGLEKNRIDFFNEYQKLFKANKLEKLSSSPITYDRNKPQTPGYYYYNLYTRKITSDLFFDLTTSKNGEREASLCPACQLSDAEVFDHYVPRSEYPFFSMNPINLIPWCSDCNLKKGDNWRDINNNRIFINFYTDIIPKKQFLFVKLVKIEKNTPYFKYYLDKPQNMPKKIYKLIKSHFTELDLITKYDRKQSDTYNDLLDEIDPNSSKESIKEWIDKKTQKYGYNNFKIVLWDFCIENKLISKILNLK